MDNWLKQAVQVIASGGVVALAYETLFGLAADALNEDAVYKSAAIKDRSPDKPISVIMPDMDAIQQVCTNFPALAHSLAQRHWPGPLTLVVPARSDIPSPLIGPGGKIGVRIPGPSPALTLARATGRILTASSANRSGGPDALDSDQLTSLEGVDLIVQGAVSGPPGSTVVDASGDHPIVLRQGQIWIENS